MIPGGESPLALAVHDIRSPLAIVSGYLKLLSTGNLGSLTSDQHEVLGEMERASRKIVRALDDLSDLANFDRATLVLDLGPTTLDTLVGGFDQAIASVGDIVVADARRMRRAFDAIHGRLTAEQGGKNVPVRGRIQSAGQDLRAEVVFGAASAVDAAVNGRRGRLVTLPASGPSGLSLLLARRIVEAHGGTVQSLGAQRLRGVIVQWPVQATMSAERTAT